MVDRYSRIFISVIVLSKQLYSKTKSRNQMCEKAFASDLLGDGERRLSGIYERAIYDR